MGRKRKQESDPQPTTLEEIQEANTLLTGEAVLQFHPPSPELAPDEQGELRAREGKGWIKLSFDFRNFLDRLRGARLSIFLDICLHINESGWAWPSLKTICRETGYNRDTAMAVIAYLTHETGILEITQSKGRVNKYRPSFAAYGKSGKFRPVVETTTTPAEVVVKTTTTTSGSFSDSKKNHKKKNQKEEPLPAPKARGRERPEDRALELLFCELTGLSPENCDPRSRSTRWWQPLQRIRKMANGRGEELIRAVVEIMRHDRLSISAPQSIEKIAQAEWGKRRQNDAHQMTPAEIADFQKWQAEHAQSR